MAHNRTRILVAAAIFAALLCEMSLRSAEAASIGFCINGPDGAPYSSCADYVFLESENFAGFAVVCRGAIGAEETNQCTSLGGSVFLAASNNFQPGDLVSGADDHWHPYANYEYFAGGEGGGDGGESSAWPELTAEQGGQIAGAILLLWSIAYVGRLLRKQIEKR
jgi:hypothetical protein